MPEPKQLKLTPLAIIYLRDKHQIDLVKGENLDLESVECLSKIYVAGLQHESKPPTLKWVMENMEMTDISEAIQNSSMIAKKKPAKKRAPRTGG